MLIASYQKEGESSRIGFSSSLRSSYMLKVSSPTSDANTPFPAFLDTSRIYRSCEEHEQVEASE